MPLYTQAGRLISLATPLGDDKLLLTGFTGREAVSRLFDFHLTTLSEDTAIDFTQIVGQSVTINVTQADDSQRYFNGIVSHFACTGKEGDMTRYELAGGAQAVDADALRRLPHLSQQRRDRDRQVRFSTIAESATRRRSPRRTRSSSIACNTARRTSISSPG